MNEFDGDRKMGWNPGNCVAISRTESMRNRSGSDPANQIKWSWIVYDCFGMSRCEVSDVEMNTNSHRICLIIIQREM